MSSYVINMKTREAMSGLIKGFTLVELMVTIVIAGILASLALPMFTSTLNNSRLTSHTNLMVGALNYARSEAVNLNADISVDVTATGWEVKNGTALLKKFETSKQGITSEPSSGTFVTYAATGFNAGNAERVMNFCDTESHGRRISVAASGSISVAKITCTAAP